MAAGRDPESVTLVAVTKAKTAELVRPPPPASRISAKTICRRRRPKWTNSPTCRLRWHFIGGIQSNKTRAIAERFDWVHSVDRLSVARRLSEQRPFHAPPLDVCIQVALVPEPTKGGVAPGGAAELARAIAALPRLRLRGLMCVPPPQPDVPPSVRCSRGCAALRDLNARGLELDTLSMGMSGDFESAIAEGATLVRIGTALFGGR